MKPEPLSGSYTHFYKTSNLFTDFGPYTPEEFSNAIDAGGVFISYLGHSGTATWDNSVSETIQLKNKAIAGGKDQVLSSLLCNLPAQTCFVEGERRG